MAESRATRSSRPRAGGEFSIRRRYHFHFPGLLYVAVTLFLAFGAFNSGNNLLYLALGLAIGGLVVSGFVSGWALMGVRVERLPVGAVIAGEVAIFRYRVTNTSRLTPVFALTLEEEPGPGWLGVFDGVQAYVAHLGPGKTVYIEAAARARRRGRIRLTGVRAWSTFPFGLARKSVTVEQPAELVALPMSVPLAPGILDAAVSKSGQSSSAERFPGRGEEFYGLREYSSGDSTARIAWRATARTGQVIVRQNAMLSPTRVGVVLSLGEKDTPLSEREKAIVLAASVLRTASREGAAVGLRVAGRDISLPPRSDRRYLERLLDELAVLDADAEPPGSGPARNAGNPDSQNAGLIVVHAGDPVRSGWPNWALHLSSSTLADHARADARTHAALESVARASARSRGATGRPRRLFAARFRGPKRGPRPPAGGRP